MNLFGEDRQDTSIDDIAGIIGNPASKEGFQPEAGLTNRAAVLALTSGSNDLSSTYEQIKSEAGLGFSPTEDSITQSMEERSLEAMYQDGVIPILSDPDVSPEDKQSAIEYYRNAGKPDSVATLAMESVIEHSEGDSISAEIVRESSIDLFESYQADMRMQQGIVNEFKMELEKRSNILSEGAGLAQELLPLAEGIKSVKLYGALQEKLGGSTRASGYLKSMFRPGGSIEDLREQYQTLPSQDRIAFIEAIVDYARDSNGVIFSTDSQMASMQVLEKITGDYSPAEATFDTVINTLDMIGIGYFIRALKGARAATSTTGDTPTTPISSLTVENQRAEDLVVRTENPEKAKLPDLYADRAELLADTSALAARGDIRKATEELGIIDQKIKEVNSLFRTEANRIQRVNRVSRGEAESRARRLLGNQLEDLQSTRDRLTQQIEVNRRASAAQERIASVDAEIRRLEKLPDTDGIIRINPVMDALYRAERNIVTENPASPGSIFFKTNPGKARSAMNAVYHSETDDIANAMFGMSRTDALSLGTMPRIVSDSGKTPAVPVGVMDDLEKTVEEIIFGRESRGLTGEEIERGAQKIINDFSSPTRIRPVTGMDGFKFNEFDGSVEISSLYGSTNRPFNTAQEAIESVKREFRAYGDVEVIPMKKTGVDYEPVASGHKGVGEFLGKVAVKRPVSRRDVQAKGPLEEFKLRYNFLDAVPAFAGEKAGSLTRHIFSSGAIFDKRLTSAANMAEGISSRLEKALQRSIHDITTRTKRLPKADREQLLSYWVEANEKGIALSMPDLLVRGFTNDQVALAKDWRKFQDVMFDLENRDLVKTLNNSGYQILDNGSDRFFARPYSKNSGRSTGYDPDTGDVRMLSSKELDDLYDSGGTMATLRSPFKHNNQDVDAIIVANRDRNYLRSFDDSDKVLNYRDGYFHVNYRAPLFIDKIDKADRSKVVTVATARNQREANEFIRNSSIDNPDFEYRSRPDKKTSQGQREDVWDLNHQGGRVAQRRRGQPLVEAEGTNRLEGTMHVDGPIESALRASTSIAGRTIYRDFIETAKARAMQEHGHLFPRKEGIVQFPSKISDISDVGNPYSRAARDARTDFEYIRYLENGYVNGLDGTFQQFLGLLANRVGEVVSRLPDSAVTRGIEEAGYTVAASRPTGVAKGAAFTAMLALNPLRQWIVQPAQLLRMSAYDPVGFPSAIGLIYDYGIGLARGTAATKKGNDFGAWVERTGVLDSIDKSNLVRGAMLTSGEQAGWWSKTGGRVTSAARIMGYDAGENINMIGHMAAVYNKYSRDGKAVHSRQVQEEMMGKVRAMTYDMAFEGDMPYNQNWLAVVTQFMQVPHKALLQGFDQRLTKMERTRLVAGDLILYGSVGSAVLAGYERLFGRDLLEGNEELRGLVEDGALQTLFNGVLSEAFEDDIELDISGSISPFEVGGYYKMVNNMLNDGGLLEALESTPSGQLLIKDNNRFQIALSSVGRLVGILPDSELNPQTVGDTLKDVARISSGFTNAEKALIAHSTQKIMTKTGQTLHEGVPIPVAVAMAFGILPKDVGQFYEDAEYLTTSEREYNEATDALIRRAIEVAVSRTGEGIDNPETIEIVNALIMDKARKHPEFAERYNKVMRLLSVDQRAALVNRAVGRLGLTDLETNKNTLRRLLPDNMQHLVNEYSNTLIKE